MRRIETLWDENQKILSTFFQGDVTIDDVTLWKESLHQKVQALVPNTKFKLLLDLSGFAPVDIQTHKAMRNIIPEILASHGLRPAFIDLFDEKPEMVITLQDQIECVAFANVHHDENKMADYRRRIGCANQQFFTDLVEANRWIRAI